MAKSIGIESFAVAKRGTQINITGNVIDENGDILADFGPNGTNFVPWFQQLTTDEQLALVNDIAQQWIVHWLLRQGAR
jgi:hypothetical protein